MTTEDRCPRCSRPRAECRRYQMAMEGGARDAVKWMHAVTECKEASPPEIIEVISDASDGHHCIVEGGTGIAKTKSYKQAQRIVEALTKMEDMQRRMDGVVMAAERGMQTVAQERDEALSQLRAVEKERDGWKKRAAQHGCNVVEGDHECG